MSKKKIGEGSHLETLEAPKCDPKTHFFLVFICQPQKWLFQSIFLMKATGMMQRQYLETLVDMGSHLGTLQARKCHQITCFLYMLSYSAKTDYFNLFWI